MGMQLAHAAIFEILDDSAADTGAVGFELETAGELSGVVSHRIPLRHPVICDFFLRGFD